MIRNSMRTWVIFLVAGATLLASLLAQSGAMSATPVPATPEEGAVVRDVLSGGQPAAAPGENLELVQYTIPPMTQLPVHRHPGMQVSTIVSGTLHYAVMDGEMTLHRAGEADPVTITPDDGEITFNAGDAIVEPEGMIHVARNIGDEPVVILTSSLLSSDEAPALIVTPEATPAA